MWVGSGFTVALAFGRRRTHLGCHELNVARRAVQRVRRRDDAALQPCGGGERAEWRRAELPEAILLIRWRRRLRFGASSLWYAPVVKDTLCSEVDVPNGAAKRAEATRGAGADHDIRFKFEDGGVAAHRGGHSPDRVAAEAVRSCPNEHYISVAHGAPKRAKLLRAPRAPHDTHEAVLLDERHRFLLHREKHDDAPNRLSDQRHGVRTIFGPALRRRRPLRYRRLPLPQPYQRRRKRSERGYRLS